MFITIVDGSSAGQDVRAAGFKGSLSRERLLEGPDTRLNRRLRALGDEDLIQELTACPVLWSPEHTRDDARAVDAHLGSISQLHLGRRGFEYTFTPYQGLAPLPALQLYDLEDIFRFGQWGWHRTKLVAIDADALHIFLSSAGPLKQSPTDGIANPDLSKIDSKPAGASGPNGAVPSVSEERDTHRLGMPSVGDLMSSGATGSNDGILGVNAQAEETSAPSGGDGQDNGVIFVVHGRDHDALNRTARVLERTTRRDVTVLHEQANGGRTLLEKFEGHASTAAYAVVLLTGDDVGGAREQAGTATEDLLRRARQNVIFELGFFFAALGRRRVAVLLEQGVEKPSDLDGLVYIALDAAGAWKAALCREVQAAGIPVDYGRIP